MPSYEPSFYNDQPKFTEEELRTALAGSGFGAGFLPQSAVFLGGSGGTVKIPDGNKVITSVSSVPVNVAPSPAAKTAEAVDGTAEKKVAVNGAAEKKETVESAVRSGVASSAETPNKSGTNTVQILPQDPFNGQLPVL